MPLPFAPLLGWLLGLGLAWAARGDRLAEDGPFILSRPFAISVSLAAFVYAPVLGYFVAFHGDWSYLYAVRWHTVPSAVDLVLVLTASCTIPLGLAAGRAPARAGRRAPLVRLAAGPAGFAIVLGVLCAHRLATSASYAQYHGAFGALPITSSALGRGVLLAVVVLGAAVAWSVRAVRS